MDIDREHQPAPRTLSELPEHVRVFLNSLEPEDIKRFKEWNEFIVWFKRSGRMTRSLVIFLMSAFGFFTTVYYFWERWRGR